jgi:hypothetical protein
MPVISPQIIDSVSILITSAESKKTRKAIVQFDYDIDMKSRNHQLGTGLLPLQYLAVPNLQPDKMLR